MNAAFEDDEDDVELEVAPPTIKFEETLSQSKAVNLVFKESLP
jgi:hypothetical protein